MSTTLALISMPVAIWLLACLFRRPQPNMTGLARNLCDLISLHMVLRDSKPEQRSELLAAHHDWRAKQAKRPDTSCVRRASRDLVDSDAPVS